MFVCLFVNNLKRKLKVVVRNIILSRTTCEKVPAAFLPHTAVFFFIPRNATIDKVILMAMKMVWKSGSKRGKLRPLRNPSLPFETEEEKDEQELLPPTEINPNHSGGKSLDSRSSEKDDLKQLFESLQSQGNQLAEVSCSISYFIYTLLQF